MIAHTGLTGRTKLPTDGYRMGKTDTGCSR